MIDLNKYAEFVEEITSSASEDLPTFHDAIHRVDGYAKANVPLLLTGAMGMCGEAGEFSEIVKKVVFHGKELTQEVHDHLVKELGDVIWYWTNTCRALGVSQEEVIVRNMEKLLPRYPGGVFSIEASENRKEGDI